MLTVEKRILKLTELANMAKLTGLIRDNGLYKFIRDWKSFVDFVHVKYNDKRLEGFEDHF